MSSPLVTIAIPFFNNQKTLPDAIKSIFAQSFQDWELLLVDDGSSDGSLAIARSIEDPRVKVISDGCNRKLPARLNQIIDLARGEYIARMDADDLCGIERIEKQVNRLASTKDLDVLGTSVVYLGLEDDMPVGQWIAPTSHAVICRQPDRMFGLAHPSIMARTSWYRNNRYSETCHLAQDFELWLRTYNHSTFSNIADVFCYYRLEHSFNYTKYIKDRYISAKFLFEYYQRQKRLGKALSAAAKQFIKLGAGCAICLVGSKQALFRRRYMPMSSAEVQAYQQEVATIKQTELPQRGK